MFQATTQSLQMEIRERPALRDIHSTAVEKEDRRVQYRYRLELGAIPGSLRGAQSRRSVSCAMKVKKAESFLPSSIPNRETTQTWGKFDASQNRERVTVSLKFCDDMQKTGDEGKQHRWDWVIYMPSHAETARHAPMTEWRRHVEEKARL